MYILGISAYYHDSAVALLKDEIILNALQEERFTRVKHDSSFPLRSIKFCLEKNNLKPKDINFIVFYDKPFVKFERLIETYFAFAPKGFFSYVAAIQTWLKDKLFQKRNIIKELKKIDPEIDWEPKLKFSDHHLSHAASAFYPSPFQEAAVLTMDGVGEWATTSLYVGKNNQLISQKEIHFPHSIGLFYSAFTYYLGFKVNSGEYKVMGLAPYGTPKYVDLIKKHLISLKNDGSFQLNIKYFNFCTGLTMTNKKFDEIFNLKKREEGEKLTQKHMDIAASMQKVTEEAVTNIVLHAKKITSSKNLCLSGGVALNCVINGILTKKKIFKDIWIQPASGDAGGALGAAQAYYYLGLNRRRITDKDVDSMQGSFLGTSYKNNEIEIILDELGANFEFYETDDLISYVAKLISNGSSVGWFNGKMEFGPRSLGARSILADPRDETMQKNLNLKIKFRESFRPFAPVVLEEDVRKWFDFEGNSPYMLKVASVKADKCYFNLPKSFGIKQLNQIRSVIPAVTHVDYSARIQTVNRKVNKNLYNLIKTFKSLTGCPILINTSFNIRGEPIVESPMDAFRCFMGTNIDVLVLENFVLLKKDQKKSLLIDYKNDYLLD